MTRINFYLSDKNASKSTSIVVKFNLRVNKTSKPYKFSAHESVSPHEWDTKKQRPKTNMVQNKNGLLKLRNRLQAIEGFLIDYLPGKVQLGLFPTIETIKASLQDALNPKTTEEKTFVTIFKKFIHEQRGLTV